MYKIPLHASANGNGNNFIQKSYPLCSEIFFLVNGRYVLKINQTSIEVFLAGDLYCTVDLDKFTLIPESCHGLNWNPDDGIHVRLQVNNVQQYLLRSSSNIHGINLSFTNCNICLLFASAFFTVERVKYGTLEEYNCGSS